MQTIAQNNFITVKTEGGILPAELLQRIADGQAEGLNPPDYHLAASERPSEAINRAWNRLGGAWQTFQRKMEQAAPSETGTTLTREWLLTLLQELGYGRLPYQGKLTANETDYPISHLYDHTPIHLISFRQKLDTRDTSELPTPHSAFRIPSRSPHSLLQEFLNRSDNHLWGFVSNGLRFRILRDNVSLTRAAYVEFDLEAMFNGELYSDFSLFWLLCHQSRVEVQGNRELGVGSGEESPTPHSLLPTPSNCWLEKWSQTAAEQGTRALDALRDGVQEAITALGRGFLAHPANRPLRDDLQSGALTTQDYYRQLLRLVYRLLFLFVAEDRDLLLLPGRDVALQRLYGRYYSISRLRRLAETRRGGPHPDLYHTLTRLFTLLRGGYAPLSLPGLGGFLFSERATPDLDAAQLANQDLLDTIRALAFTIEGRVRRPVDYKNMGSEELGSVYESLLELHPRLHVGAATFVLDVAAGSERKTTGSYYTPASLIQSLLDTALEPVVADRLRRVGSGEWGVGSRGKRAGVGLERRDDDDNTIVPRSKGLAGEYGHGGELLRTDKSVPPGGNVRDDKPDSASGGIRSSEYSRGTRTGDDGRVHPLSPHRPGVAQGIGDTSDPLRAGEIDHQSGSATGSQSVRSSGQNAAGLDSVVGEEGVESREWGVGDRTPHSPPPYSPLPTPYSPQEEAILAIRVVDPACGSGHFLIAAARRLARHLARVRTGDDEPGPEAVRVALRDVVGRCIFGVDINEMAVELCKVALWMETLDPGRPLSFLDANIQCGNSLMGATPALLAGGIPDAAFTPITGDDKAYCTEWKKRNRQEREGQQSLFTGEMNPWEQLGNLAAAMRRLYSADDGTLTAVHTQEAEYARLVQSSDYEYGKLWADAWVAAFLWEKKPEEGSKGVGSGELGVENPLLATAYPPPPSSGWAQPLTHEIFRKLGQNPYSEKGYWAEIRRLAAQYQFFHWHLAFPQVFTPEEGSWEWGVGSGGGSPTPHSLLSTPSPTGWTGGFDVVLGNPPWERIKLQEKEWFAARDEAIATAPNAAARRTLIAQLPKSNPALHEAFMADKRKAEGESAFVRNSGRYPLCGRGDVNTYTLFAEMARHIQSDTGRVGVIVPSGIATDDTTKYYFQDIMDGAALVSLYDFENRKGLFPAVDSRMKFSLLTLTGPERPAAEGAQFVFFALDVADLREEERRFTLSAADIALLNPNTRTCPIFRGKRDAELTKGIYRRVPVLMREGVGSGGVGSGEENPWGIKFFTMFHMSNDSGLFRTREQLEAEGWRLVGNQFVDAVSNRANPENDSAAVENDSATAENGSATAENDSATAENDSAAAENDSAAVENGSAAAENDSAAVENGSATAENDSAAAENDSAMREGGAAGDAHGNARLQGAYLPLYEGRMIHHFDHRVASVGVNDENAFRSGVSLETTIEQHVNPKFFPMPRYWVLDTHTSNAYPDNYKPDWFIGFKDVSSATNERTMINAIIPKTAVGNKVPLLISQTKPTQMNALMSANISSFAFDFVAKQKMGGVSLNFFIVKQLPVLPPQTYHQPCLWGVGNRELGIGDTPHSPLPTPYSLWLLPRILELTYTAYDLRPFAQDCGYHGPPFRWDEERRFLLRCELDAAYFHLYGIERDDVAYIMDTFPIVRRKDEAAHGEYRTKRVILEMYDEMAVGGSRELGVGSREENPTPHSLLATPYQTRLEPPPAHPDAAHPWDEAYLGPELPQEKWWQEEKGSRELGVGNREENPTPHSPLPTPHSLTLTPPPVKGKAKAAPPPALDIQPALVTDFTPPQGSYAQRLKRVMALGQPKNQLELTELIAALGDENGQIRWLAGASLVRVGGLVVVRLLAAYLQTEPGAVGREEALKALALIGETSEDEAVRQAVKEAGQ